jgi:outer membrane scaffolding protein for murein synthesis (MipA/OmpV family)
MKIVFFSLLFTLSILNAKDDYTFDYGIGMSYINIPEYIGAKNTTQYVLPYPYIYYSSKKITIEKNSLFKHIYNSKKFKIDMSFSGTVPVKSTIDSLRYGMEDLDLTLEAGPNFIYKYIRIKNINIDFNLPIRGAFAIGNSIDTIGYLYNPNISFRYYKYQLEFEAQIGVSYANKDYYNYFYEVTQKDRTSNREIYSSKSGFGGYKSSIGFSYLTKHMFYGGFIRYYDLKNAVFKDSSLVNSNHATFVAFKIGYIFN